MKKLLLSAALLLSLGALLPSTADSRTPECDAAVVRCYERCQEAYWGIGFLVDGCKAGCNVGYLFC